MYKNTIITLENGLKVGFVKTDIPNIFCVHIRGAAGSNIENYLNIGTAHLLEHILFDNRYVECINTEGSKSIGICSRDDVVYGFKTLYSNLTNILEFINSLLSQKLYSSIHIDKHKDDVINEICRHNTNLEKILIRSIYKGLFPNHRISEWNTGTPEHVQKISNNDLAAFYRSYYTTTNFVIQFCGNFNQSSRENILEYLGNIPKLGDLNIRYNQLEKNNLANTTVIRNEATLLNLCKINFYSASLNDTIKYPFTLLANMLERHLNKQNNLPHKVKVSQYASASYGILDIYSKGNNDDIQVLIRNIFNYLNNFTIDDYNLNTAKKQTINTFLLNTDKLTNMTDFYSEQLLHVKKTLNVKQEHQNIMNCSVAAVENALNYIKSQEPKITLLLK